MHKTSEQGFHTEKACRLAGYGRNILKTVSKKELNVLYTCDEKYAPFAGVSMTSLFRNNPDIGRIRVYLVLDGVSEENQARYKTLAEQYGREVVLIDARNVVEKIRALRIPTYRGSYSANFRLFFTEFIPDPMEKLLYLDSDTLVTGSLKPLLELDTTGYWFAMVRDSMMLRRDKIFDYEAPYNSGVLLIDVPAWKRDSVTQKLLDHIRHVRARYVNPDQDLLNVVGAGHILCLPPEYNFPPIHRAYPDKIYYREAPTGFYTPAQLEQARQHPVILHTYRFLGEFPWHKGTLHPDAAIFDSYLRSSLWKNYEKQPGNQSVLFRAERVLYRVLPRGAFFWLLNTAQYWSFKKQEEELQRELAADRKVP